MRVCPSAVKERFRKAIHRRRYRVPHPNSLWVSQVDTVADLIHGGVDGYSHIPVYSDNYRATTVLAAFEHAVVSHHKFAQIEEGKMYWCRH